MVGNSIGKPPAAMTPRFTCSATVRRCALQCVASLQEFAIPTTGLSANDSSLQPWLLRPARCKNPSRLRGPNQAWLRSTRLVFVFGFKLRCDG